MELCLNCGAELTGRYCHACGQKIPRPDPTLGEFLRDATEELVHWDGKIPTTLVALMTKPGQLTLDFLQGRRARWLLPLRLYLICSVVYFVTGPAVEAVTNRKVRQAVRFGVTVSDSSQLTPEVRAELDSSAITRLIGKERMERIIANPSGLQREFSRNYPKAMFVLLPLFAFLTHRAFRKVAPRYPAHLYYALHLHAAAFAALTLTTVLRAPGGIAWEVIVQLAGLSYIVWFAFRSARVVFGTSVAGTLGRLTLVGIAYWFLTILTTIGLIFIALSSA